MYCMGNNAALCFSQIGWFVCRRRDLCEAGSFLWLACAKADGQKVRGVRRLKTIRICQHNARAALFYQRLLSGTAVVQGDHHKVDGTACKRAASAACKRDAS